MTTRKSSWKKAEAKLNALKSAEVIKNFIDWARSSRERKTFNDNLAATLIYSSLSEFIAQSLLSFNRYVKGAVSDSKEPTNLEYLINELESYDFNLKDKIIPLLYKIKDQRNKLFHNLVVAQEKGLNIASLMRNVQNDTESLMGLWGNYLKGFFVKS